MANLSYKLFTEQQWVDFIRKIDKLSRDNAKNAIGGIKEYDSTATYAAGDITLYIDPTSGKFELYKCKSNDTTGAWDQTKWDMIKHNGAESSSDDSTNGMRYLGVSTTLSPADPKAGDVYFFNVPTSSVAEFRLYDETDGWKPLSNGGAAGGYPTSTTELANGNTLTTIDIGGSKIKTETKPDGSVVYVLFGDQVIEGRLEEVETGDGIDPEDDSYYTYKIATIRTPGSIKKLEVNTFPDFPEEDYKTTYTELTVGAGTKIGEGMEYFYTALETFDEDDNCTEREVHKTLRIDGKDVFTMYPLETSGGSSGGGSSSGNGWVTKEDIDKIIGDLNW